jgi:multiple sugar transport system substrate-binding protein
MRCRALHACCGVLLLLTLACAGDPDDAVRVVFPASAVGAEAELLTRQIARFQQEHPEVEVELRPTPDAADQRHQLYVQWLNAGLADPDVLQLDVVWTPEFAGAGWIRPLDAWVDDAEDFLPATLEANRLGGALHALPWFADVGMLYWRTDLLDAPPRSFDELSAQVKAALHEGVVSQGLVWQGARYEGLITVFVEYLGGFGGRLLDDQGQVALDSPQALRALEEMRRSIRIGVVPEEVLGWQEEQTRFAFQSGRALFMRNWPYAVPLLNDPEHSRVAGRFAVAPMPAETGRPTATLGGSQLAINARSDVPEAAWLLVEYLTEPARMIERARELGQLPTRTSLYRGDLLEGALPVPVEQARRLVESAAARPATPVYTELSGVIQVWLHRALSGQEEPAIALARAAEEARAVLRRKGLDGG